MQAILPDEFITLGEAISRFEVMLFVGQPERRSVLRAKEDLGPHKVGDED